MLTVFPAHAGMSRHASHTRACVTGFPRPRGDEPPHDGVPAVCSVFSPPTRG